MNNLFNEQQLREIQKMIDNAIKKIGRQQIHQGDIRPTTIKREHLEDAVIVIGTTEDRPTDNQTGVNAHYATDTGTLSIWTVDQWLETVLT